VATCRGPILDTRKPQFAQVGGFALYLARAVLSGRGDEIIELAKTNIFR